MTLEKMPDDLLRKSQKAFWSECVKDEFFNPFERMLRGGDDYRRPARGLRRVAKQAPPTWLYRNLCRRQYPAEGLGVGHGSHDGIR